MESLAHFQDNMSRVVVVGAGVIGLSTAVALQRRLPRIHVTLISELLSPDTTGDGSAGLWMPYLLGDTPNDDITRWASSSYAMFMELWRSPLAAEAGISAIPLLWLTTEDKPNELPQWRDLVLGFNVLTAEHLHQLSVQCGKKYNFGFTFVTFTCEPIRLLPFLLKEFRQQGGVLKQQRVDSLTQLSNERFDVIVNCTGLSGGKLADDPSVVPIRGQVIRVKAPWVKYAILDDDNNGNYIIPNIDSVVLGGTQQRGDWNTKVCPNDRKFILEGCKRMIPSLKDAEILQDWVGLRPGRPRVRLERETKKGQRGNKYQVVHNYGHGGSGITLSWGCAQDAVDKIQQALLEMTPQAKL